MVLDVQCHQQCADSTDQQDRNPQVPFFLAFADAVHNETQHGKAKPEPVHNGVLSWAERWVQDSCLGEVVTRLGNHDDGRDCCCHTELSRKFAWVLTTHGVFTPGCSGNQGNLEDGHAYGDDCLDQCGNDNNVQVHILGMLWSPASRSLKI